jgi:hypothetical protein
MATLGIVPALDEVKTAMRAAIRPRYLFTLSIALELNSLNNRVRD